MWRGYREPAEGTHKEEFYEVVDLPDSLKKVNQMLRAWKEVYNCYRPHRALGYLPPKEFHQNWLNNHQRKEAVSDMS